jgi:hypothetical protein
MAVQCGTVTVLYFVTLYRSVFDVMVVQCGRVTVLFVLSSILFKFFKLQTFGLILYILLFCFDCLLVSG